MMLLDFMFCPPGGEEHLPSRERNEGEGGMNRTIGAGVRIPKSGEVLP